ncbi:MAG: hypothetical protein ACR2RV_15055, partial [Verrucomicrobiales bacterium]
WESHPQISLLLPFVKFRKELALSKVIPNRRSAAQGMETRLTPSPSAPATATDIILGAPV